MNTTTRRRAGGLLLGAALAVTAMAAVSTSAYAANYVDPSVIVDKPITLDTGHIDAFNLISTANGSIRLVLKEDVTGSGVLREPESVTLRVKESAKMTLPDSAATMFKPLTDEGLTKDFYYLPLTQNYELIWPGWDSQGAASALGITDVNKATSDHTIESATGPKDSKVLMWSQGSFGGVVSVLTNGAYGLPATIHQPLLAHQHINWAFTKAGVYKLTVHSSATTTDGKSTVTSESHVYTFRVGDIPEVDVAKLDAAIAVAGGYERAGYTQDSWTAFAAALAAAGQTRADENASQADIDAAVSTLAAAQQALVSNAPKADVAKLDAAIAAADGLKRSEYTADSWKSFGDALAAAKGVRADENASQSDVDAAVAALTKARQALVSTANSPDGGGTKDDGDTKRDPNQSSPADDPTRSGDQGGDAEPLATTGSALQGAVMVSGGLAVSAALMTLVRRQRRNMAR